MLQQYHARHIQSDVTRLYLPRKNGGRGLINIANHHKNAIINFSSYLLKSEEQFMKLISNWQVTRGGKSIHQKAQQYCDETGLDIQQLAAIRKLPLKITIKSTRINKLEAELKKKEYAWAICKIPRPIICSQRAIQPMAKIFYPKKIYRVINSSHPRTGNFHQIY